MREYWSNYVSMGNDPASKIDPTGGCTDCPPDYVLEECPSCEWTYHPEDGKWSTLDKDGVGGLIVYEKDNHSLDGFTYSGGMGAWPEGMHGDGRSDPNMFRDYPNVVWSPTMEELGAAGRENLAKMSALDAESEWLDYIQTGLDVAGLIPGFGEVADGLNALIYLGKGDYINAGLSVAAMVPVLGWAATGTKVVLKTLPWSSQALAKAAKLLENGATSIKVRSKEEAEELFMGLYQGGNGKAFVNTTGLNAVETKNLHGSKAGTYHWDLNDTQHGGMPHLQIHAFDGTVTRIFFEN